MSVEQQAPDAGQAGGEPAQGPAAADARPAAVEAPPPADAAAADRDARTKALLRGTSAVDMQRLVAPVVICGPSGVGKGTIIGRLMADHPSSFGFSVSHTTRGPRPGEANGQHYHFVDAEVMRSAVDKGAFLEHAEVHGNMYGTSLSAVAAVSSQGKMAILDIDVQGAEQVRQSVLGNVSLFIFLAPPSHEELERRLRGRGTETEEKVLKRLANAKSEVEKSSTPGLFDRIIVNDDLEAAVLQVAAAIEAHVPGTVPGAAERLAKHEAAKAAGAGGAPVSGGENNGAAPAANGGAAPAPVANGGAPPAPTANGGAPPAPTANGGAAPAPVANGGAPPAPTANGGTAALLDFGFGSAAGAGAATKGMPVRAYMDATVVPVLRDGLKALNLARPDDPLSFLAQFIQRAAAARNGPPQAGGASGAPAPAAAEAAAA